MKSVTLRNLLGGFLGGSIGIIVSWYISPMALPFGVLLGVLVGWHHLEIFNAALSLIKVAATWTKSVYQFASRVLKFPGSVLASLKRVGALFSEAYQYHRRWLSEHPTNKIVVIRMLVYFASAIVLSFIFKTPRNAEPTPWAWFYILLFFGTVGGVASRLFVEGWERENSNLGVMKHFYRNWEIYSRYGASGTVVYDIWRYARFVAGTIAFIVATVPLFLISAALFVSYLLVMIPIVTGKGLYRVASSSRAHLLCLTVTMAVTALSWFRLHDTFGDVRMLWFVALTTGAASGAITEILRLAYVRVYLLFQRISLGGLSSFERSTSFLGMVALYWFKNSHRARQLRAVCFEMPIEQSVRIV